MMILVEENRSGIRRAMLLYLHWNWCAKSDIHSVLNVSNTVCAPLKYFFSSFGADGARGKRGEIKNFQSPRHDFLLPNKELELSLLLLST